MIFLAQIDLTSEAVVDIRSRLAEDEDSLAVVQRTAGLWTVRKGAHTATFLLLDVLGNGDRVYLVVGSPQVGSYLTNRLGARVRTWLDAATDVVPRVVLGNVSPRDWLLARMSRTYVAQPGEDPAIDGAPLPNHVIAGQRPSSALFEV